MRVANGLQSPFGAGWTVEGLARLAFNAGGSVTVVATGISPTYHPGPTRDTYTPDGDFATFTHHPGGTYTRTAASGATMDFDAAGRLITRADRNANATAYGYDGAGRLATVTDPAGPITTFSHDAEGNLTAVTFPGEKRAGKTGTDLQPLHDQTFSWFEQERSEILIQRTAGTTFQ